MGFYNSHPAASLLLPFPVLKGIVWSLRVTCIRRLLCAAEGFSFRTEEGYCEKSVGLLLPNTQLPGKPSHSKEICVLLFRFFPTPNMGCSSFCGVQMSPSLASPVEISP